METQLFLAKPSFTDESCVHTRQTAETCTPEPGIAARGRTQAPHTPTQVAQPGARHAWLDCLLLTPLVQLKQHRLKCG